MIIVGLFCVVAVGGLVWSGQKFGSSASTLLQIQMNTMKTITLTSSAFLDNTLMPARFTCDGENTIPPFEISNIPTQAKSLALVLHDPDAQAPGGWTHWVKFNISTETTQIEEGKEPEGFSGEGGGGSLVYQGPCPPSGTHRYIFTIYALDKVLTLSEGATETELKEAMATHILGEGTLTGLYKKI